MRARSESGPAKSSPKRYPVVLSDAVKWQLAQMSPEEREQALAAIEAISEDPFIGEPAMMTPELTKIVEEATFTDDPIS